MSHAEIEEVLAVVSELELQFGVARNQGGCGPLLFVGVVDAGAIAALTPSVERRFGPAFKAAGTGTFFKNLSDAHLKRLGGVRKDQTLFLREVPQAADVYCMFWPWGSNPQRISVRIGLMCHSPALATELAARFQPVFQPSTTTA